MNKIANKIIALTIGLLILCAPLTVDSKNYDYYFNQSISFDDAVIGPTKFLGNEIGEWHIRPDQSYAYFKQLAKSSDKVMFEELGYSHENRPLVASYISSADNLKQLDKILAARSNLTDYQGPNIVYLGYSVHGNEASGANAAPLVAYRLAASKEPWIAELLKTTIVIIDPMLNPDGIGRFAHWANMYKGKKLVSDPASIEHNEAWPQARTNHYWFDLNRDWLLLQQPESQARAKLFYRWRPHIVGDFHEMGTNSTYFFQPGVPSRQNPLTSKDNFILTNQIAAYHAKALDAVGSSYYSKESFDDFYYGKGSTFPDINGGIGILYEQASARGHLQQSVNGDLSFPFAIRNHVATSFSTLSAALELKDTLADYQKDFFASTSKKALADSDKAVIFTSPDAGRLQEMLRLLKAHQIEVQRVNQDANLNQQQFPAQSSYLVKFAQQQYGLIKAIFETRTEFSDNTFYDVSAWTFPLALNLRYQFLNYAQLNRLSLDQNFESKGRFIEDKNAEKTVAFIIPSDNFNSLSLLNQLLAAKVKVKLATKPFTLAISGVEQQFAAGALIVSANYQSIPVATIRQLLEQSGLSKGIDVYAVASGFSSAGIDLGSPSVKNIKLPKPLLLIGSGVSPYEAGEVWHLLDTRVGLGLAMQQASNIKNIELSNYSHLLLVNGSYPELNEKELKKLKDWLKKGGNIVASRRAISWLIRHKITDFEIEVADKKMNQQRLFSQRDDAQAEHIIGGAIYRTELDETHPLSYGIGMDYLPVTKAGTQVLKPAQKEFLTVASYADNPLMAGYSSQENVARIKNSPAVLATSVGRGTVVLFNDNPNFRGYWLGSARMYLNSLFFNSAF